MTRRRFVGSLASASVSVGALAGTAFANTYPTRPVRMIVPFVPGGGTDTAARIFARFMTDALGQQVVIENQGGAGGIIGTTAVARAAPDGYTVLFAPQTPITITQFLKPLPPYDAEKDLKPPALASSAPALLLAAPSLSAKNLQEFIADAKSKPGFYTFGSPGIENEFHLMVELIKHHAGIDIVHVPFRGTAPAVTAVIADQIHLVVAALGNGLAFVADGKARALAVFGEGRLPQLPDVPTITEMGFPDANIIPWFGVFAPARTPSDVVDEWDKAKRKVQELPKWQEDLAKIGYTSEPKSLEQFETLIQTTRSRWKELTASLALSDK